MDIGIAVAVFIVKRQARVYRKGKRIAVYHHVLNAKNKVADLYVFRRAVDNTRAVDHCRRNFAVKRNGKRLIF